MWGALQARLTDNEVLAVVAQEVNAAFVDLLPGADDLTIERYVALWAEKAAFISDLSPQVCADVVFRSRKLGELRSRLPRALVSREQALVRAVLETSSAQRIRRFTGAEIDALRLRVLGRMKPQAARVVMSIHSGRVAPAAACSAAIQFLEAVLALPVAERPQAARMLVSQE
jgi:hypothetical protein